eukprot:1722625-Rhodomonas_salina.4
MHVRGSYPGFHVLAFAVGCSALTPDVSGRCAAAARHATGKLPADVLLGAMRGPDGGSGQPVETKIMSDTSLEKPKPHHSNISRQMDDRGGLQGEKEDETGGRSTRLQKLSR